MIPYPALRSYVSNHPYPLLFTTISGAHLYGFPSIDSDYDLRGVHLLPMDELISLLPEVPSGQKALHDLLLRIRFSP